MVVYVPMWFKIKYNPSVRDGAKQVFNTIIRVIQLDQNLQEIVLPVVHRNAYFAQSENLLLSMVADERPPVG